MPNVSRVLLSGRPIRVLLETQPATNMLPHADHEPLVGSRFEPGLFGIGLRTAIVHQSSVAVAPHLAREFGLSVEPLCETDRALLRSYDWPGNVRELRNVLERAMITSADANRLHLERALPEVGEAPGSDSAGPSPSSGELLTARGLKELERSNLVRALERTNWRVGGTSGAAQLLGMNASTLKSRMKALNVQRPQEGR